LQSLKALFRKTPPETLQTFFADRAPEMPVDWSLMDGKLANCIDDALHSLPDDQEDGLRAELELIQELSGTDGWTAIEQLCRALGIEIPEDGGAEDAAFFIAIEHPSQMDRVSAAHSRTRKFGGQQWAAFRLESGTFSPNAVADLTKRHAFVEAALKAKGFDLSRNFEADWFAVSRRDELTDTPIEVTFLTLYLQERSTNELTVVGTSFQRALTPRVAEMIVTVNPHHQEIEVSVKGGWKTQKAVADAFTEQFLDGSAEPIRIEQREVDFDVFKRKPDLSIWPEDRINAASIVKLEFTSDHLKTKFEHPSEDSAIYDLIEGQFAAATIKITRDREFGKTLTIDLRWPNKTTLPNQTEEDRKLSYTLLERWGILPNDEALIEQD